MLREAVTSLFGSLDPAVDLDDLLRQAGEAVVYVDQDWTVRYCNDVYVANIGLPRHQIIGKTPFEYEPTFRRSIFYESIARCRADRRPTAKIGYSTVLDRWLMVRVFPAGDGIMMLANDASETVVKQYQLAQQVVKCALTGLPNKLALTQDVEELLGRGDVFALTVIGLDRFRSINDALGYAGGDLALLEAASRLQTATVPGEQLYRLNGDEFAVLHRHGMEVARERVQALIAATATPFLIRNQRFVLGASAGCVDRRRDFHDPERVLKCAGLALHQAKKTSRGGLVVYEAGLEAASQLRAQLESELRAAIETDQLVLVLQPKGCLLRGSVLGAEALIRWAHPKRGMVPPGDFLPLAAEAGLMNAIDMLVLKQALRLIGQLSAAGIEVPVSINLSVASLGDVCVVDRVRAALHQSGVPPHRLEVEVPEGALMEDVDASAKTLAGLDAMGVKISVDDFGTGYSSFAYLARFPVHELKIDRSFVKDITSSDASQKIVRGMVRLAHSLQMQVVAEGAEGDAEIDALRRMRCDSVQGYGYGRPMPLADFIAFARARQGAGGAMSALTI